MIYPVKLPERVQHADGCHRLLFMSRIHKKKGLVEFMSAWGKVRPRGWKFEIVGFDEDGSLKHAMEVASKGGFLKDIIYTGPLGDEEKWRAYRRADAFVLPTYSENFGIVVAEALYAGIPVITTTGTPWYELVDKNCGWWVDGDPVTLAGTLEELTRLDDSSRMSMGERGRQLIEDKYMWPSIAKKMINEYESLLHR